MDTVGESALGFGMETSQAAPASASSAASASAASAAPPSAASVPPASRHVPLYAQGAYHRELNYKLWSTYKSRFNAAERCKKKYDLSTKAVAFLSAYVVIFALITVMLPQYSAGKVGQITVFISSSLSILILVMSQLEASQNYSVKALTFHQSGLAVADLYKELRALKTRYDDKSDKEFITEVEEVSKKYDDILQRSENHEAIDFDCFKASKPKYEDHNMKEEEVKRVKNTLFMAEYSIYYAFMIVPPILFGLFVGATAIWGK
jgi:hypothetical protein